MIQSYRADCTRRISIGKHIDVAKQDRPFTIEIQVEVRDIATRRH